MTDRSHTLGDAPIEEQYREQMKKLGEIIDSYFNGLALPGLPKGKKRKTGFILMVFPFGEVKIGGRCNYVVVLLKEQIKRFEGQPDVTGRA
jgi:hypothetical protein